MVDLVLWSGGLDSTWLLHKISTESKNRHIYVLSLNLQTNENHLINSMEIQARQKLKSILNNKNNLVFMEAGVNVRHPLNISILRIGIMTCFIAGQYAKSLQMTKEDNIWFGSNCDDDAVILHNLSSRIDKYHTALSLSYEDDNFPRTAWITPPPSRIQQLRDLGPLANLTWSCRNPTKSLQECGKCTPCTYIQKAKKEIQWPTQ